MESPFLLYTSSAVSSTNGMVFFLYFFRGTALSNCLETLYIFLILLPVPGHVNQYSIDHQAPLGALGIPPHLVAEGEVPLHLGHLILLPGEPAH